MELQIQPWGNSFLILENASVDNFNWGVFELIWQILSTDDQQFTEISQKGFWLYNPCEYLKLLFCLSESGHQDFIEKISTQDYELLPIFWSFQELYNIVPQINRQFYNGHTIKFSLTILFSTRKIFGLWFFRGFFENSPKMFRKFSKIFLRMIIFLIDFRRNHLYMILICILSWTDRNKIAYSVISKIRPGGLIFVQKGFLLTYVPGKEASIRESLLL